MIHWTDDDQQMLAHVVDVMSDRMRGEDGYIDTDWATMTKLEKLATGGPAVTITGEDRDHAAELAMFEQIVKAEMDNWVPGASQRLIFRASRALSVGHYPDPAFATRTDCGPERGSHALVANWTGSLYVYRCASCHRLFRA